MSKGPENRFIASIHRLLPKGLHFEKMHNTYRGGTFDVWYSGHARHLWIEYKWVNKKTTKPPALSELQKKWGKARYEEGRHVAVIVGCPEGGVLYLTPYSWERDGEAKLMHTRQELASWIVLFTTGASIESKTKRRGKRHGKRLQNTSHRVTNLRANKIQNNREE